jgi:hypothetical protein
MSSESLEDITGCPSVRMSFDDPAVKAQLDSGALFDTLRACDQVGHYAEAARACNTHRRGGRPTFGCTLTRTLTRCPSPPPPCSHVRRTARLPPHVLQPGRGQLESDRGGARGRARLGGRYGPVLSTSYTRNEVDTDVNWVSLDATNGALAWLAAHSTHRSCFASLACQAMRTRFCACSRPAAAIACSRFVTRGAGKVRFDSHWMWTFPASSDAAHCSRDTGVLHLTPRVLWTVQV